jgi:hypothetical protein
VSAAALGISASVLPTTTRAVILLGGFTGKSIEGFIVSTVLFLRSAGGLVSGFGASPAAEEICKAIFVPSGRTAPGAASGSVFCAEVSEATPPTD